jgi:hypothetical protein
MDVASLLHMVVELTTRVDKLEREAAAAASKTGNKPYVKRKAVEQPILDAEIADEARGLVRGSREFKRLNFEKTGEWIPWSIGLKDDAESSMQLKEYL